MTDKPVVDLDIIIPTYNRPRDILKTAEGLLAQSVMPNSLIIVNQTSHLIAPSSDLVEAYNQSGTKLIWMNRSVPNLCGARNAGITLSNSTICLFLDDDVLLPPALIEGHWLKYQNMPHLAAVGGQVFHRLATFPMESLSIEEPTKGTSPALCSPIPKLMGPLFGGHFSVRRSAVYAIGGWDEALVGSANWEEGDFMHRLQNYGYEYLWDPAIWLIHYRSPTGGCRIPNSSQFPEWTKTVNFFTISFRYPHDKPKPLVWRTVLRAGPLRKEVVKSPLRWVPAWVALLWGWREARYRAEHPQLRLAVPKVQPR